VNDGPCVTHVGPGGAGNYVKMVHNGIEYGDMQLISEAYDILKNVGGLSNDELAKVFAEWNDSELQSYLIEITRNIFMVKVRTDGSARGPTASARVRACVRAWIVLGQSGYQACRVVLPDLFSYFSHRFCCCLAG
jgi:6-phosphogluconate dehydrogenase (decarboxylating)